MIIKNDAKPTSTREQQTKSTSIASLLYSLTQQSISLITQVYEIDITVSKKLISVKGGGAGTPLPFNLLAPVNLSFS